MYTFTDGMGREATVFYKRLADLLNCHSLGTTIQLDNSLGIMPLVFRVALISRLVHMWKQVFCALSCPGATGLVSGC